MKSVTVRGIDDTVAKALKQYAVEKGTSVNSAIVTLLKTGLGIKKQPRQRVYHDLDELAGGWDEDEFNTFENNTKSLNEIDEDLWT